MPKRLVIKSELMRYEFFFVSLLLNKCIEQASRVKVTALSRHGMPHQILFRSAHPSPLSARRGFLGNGHFRSANEWLLSRYGAGIDWSVLR